MLEAARLAAEKLAAERLAAEKLAAEKLAAEKLAAEKLAAEEEEEEEEEVYELKRVHSMASGDSSVLDGKWHLENDSCLATIEKGTITFENKSWSIQEFNG